MNTQSLMASIGRVECWYNIPTGSLSYKRGQQGVVIANDNIRISSIKQILALYFTEEMKIKLKDVAELLGFKDHTSVISALKVGRGYRDNGDSGFMLYYNTVMGLMTKEIAAKGTREFKEKAEAYIQNNPHKTKMQVAADLGITMNTLNVYLRNLDLYDNNKYSNRIERPPARYSNQNNISQYFD